MGDVGVVLGTMGPSTRTRTVICRCICAAVSIITLIFTIVLLTGIRQLDANEQMVEYKQVREVHNGPGTVWVSPFLKNERREALTLTAEELAVIKDSYDGSRRVQRGPGIFFLGPYEEADNKESAVLCTAAERVLVTDTRSGQVSAVDGPVLYFRKENESVQKAHRIQVAEFQTAVVRQATGALVYHSGAPSGLNFFLDAHEQLEEFHWTIGGDVEDHPDKRKVTLIDTRIQQMPFWFDDMRTADNIEYEMEGQIFWQVVDVAALVRGTADPTGDIWNRLRARMGQVMSTMHHSSFLEQSGNLTSQVLLFETVDNEAFYRTRGLQLHSIELHEAELADEALENQTVHVVALESTNRINEVQRQLSLNAVERARLEGVAETNRLTVEIEKATEEARWAKTFEEARNQAALRDMEERNQFNESTLQLANQLILEQQRGNLLAAQTANELAKANGEGSAEGGRLGSAVERYLSTLASSLTNTTEALNIYTLHQELASRNHTTHNLASGTAQLYLTSEAANLHLGTPVRTEL